MTTTQKTSTATDIAEAFDLAGLTPSTSRWGHQQARLDADRTVQVAEDDGILYVTLYTGGAAMLNTGDVRLAGALASPVMLAAVIEQIAA